MWKRMNDQKTFFSRCVCLFKYLPNYVTHKKQIYNNIDTKTYIITLNMSSIFTYAHKNKDMR